MGPSVRVLCSCAIDWKDVLEEALLSDFPMYQTKHVAGGAGIHPSIMKLTAPYSCGRTTLVGGLIRCTRQNELRDTGYSRYGASNDCSITLRICPAPAAWPAPSVRPTSLFGTDLDTYGEKHA